MLSSKNWMCFVAVIGLLFSSSMAMGQTRYSNQRTMQQRQVSQNGQGRIRTAMRDMGVDQVAPPVPAKTHVARAYVPKHIQTGIQTGVTQASAPMADAMPETRQPRVEVSQGQQVRSASARTSTGPRMAARTSAPRNGQMITEGPIYDGAMMSGGYVDGGCVGCGGPATHTYSNGCATCGSAGCSPGFGGPVDMIGESYIDGGYVDDGWCGNGCMDDCCNRGGCPPMALEECWLGGLFGIFSNGEYFLGGNGFRSTQFQVPGQNDIFDDCSFGLYGGFNFGLPLCRLTCGVLSGQLGVRAVSSELDGNSFFSDNRDQTFITAGLFRRVDYGIQFGVVADILREEWFAETETVQLRGDISWVYPSGCALGFRFTNGVQDDNSIGTIAGAGFTGLNTSTIETYRFYYRHASNCGGYSDFSLGWSDDDHFVLGLDYDMPISNTVSLQSSMTYLAGDDVPATSPFAGNGNEAWNLSVGFAYRPQGRRWYRRYDRPMFNVADNGSMILRRQ